MWLFCNVYFERNYDILKSKRLCFLLDKNIKFNKNETRSKMENSTHTFREINCFQLCFSLYKNCELKVKLWWVGAREWKKCIFVSLNLSEGSFFNICVFISMYSVFNKLSEYIQFCISKNITSYTFFACF